VEFAAGAKILRAGGRRQEAKFPQGKNGTVIWTGGRQVGDRSSPENIGGSFSKIKGSVLIESGEGGVNDKL